MGISIRIYSLARVEEEIIHKDGVPLIKETVYLRDIRDMGPARTDAL